MSLPTALLRWWPFFKRLHRLLTATCGLLFRPVGRLLGPRGVPRSATERSTQTAAAEPDAVTLHPGRPSVVLTRRPVTGDPADHWVFERARTATIPATFTLEVRDGQVVGDYAATVTPGRVLDHETSNYFGVEDWREHPIFLRPTVGRIEHIPGTALSLTARGTNVNYYHFLYDAIARYGVLEESLPGQRIDAVIVSHATRYQRQLLELAGIPGPYVQPERGRTYSADRLLVPSNPNWALDAPPSMVEWIRGRLRPSARAGDTPRRLYLTRGNKPGNRRYVQEDELWPYLEKRGFECLDPGRLSVQEQIDVFHRAEVVVGPHGAALTNLTFSEPGVRVLEMFASTYVHLGLWSIAQAVDADYHYLVASGPGGPEGPNAGIADDVSIPVDRVRDAVDALIDT